MSKWIYVLLTAILAAVVAVWSIPYLGDSTGFPEVWVKGNSLLGVSLAVRIDSLAAQVLLLAVGVGLLVQIYSTAYLAHHPRYPLRCGQGIPDDPYRRPRSTRRHHRDR